MDLLSGISGVLPVDLIASWLSSAMQSEYMKIIGLFFLAAEVHKRAMKKEFGLLRGSIDHVADVMGKRIDGIEVRLNRIEKKDGPNG